jgi:hypothetical protein
VKVVHFRARTEAFWNQPKWKLFRPSPYGPDNQLIQQAKHPLDGNFDIRIDGPAFTRLNSTTAALSALRHVSLNSRARISLTNAAGLLKLPSRLSKRIKSQLSENIPGRRANMEPLHVIKTGKSRGQSIMRSGDQSAAAPHR